MNKKCLMLRKYSYSIMQSGLKQEARLNKEYDSILFFKSSKEATEVTGARHDLPSHEVAAYHLRVK